MKKIYGGIIVILLAASTACTHRSTVPGNREMKAPAVSLSDTLSGQKNDFELQSGNYQFRYTDNGELMGVAADGKHPLDLNMEKEEKLNVSIYNGIDAVPYLLSCKVEPDHLALKEWDISQAGDMEAEPKAEGEYEESFLVDLKPGRIYEFTLEWRENNLEKNGFCGKASYAVITE